MRARLRTKLLGTVLLYLGLLALVGALGLYAAQSSLDGMPPPSIITSAK